MPLSLEAFAARLPELGTPPRHAFVLIDLLGARPDLKRNVPDDELVSRNPLGARAPLCLALAIDASSSMRGSRFALAIQAARDLIDSMGPQDRVAIVVFDRNARVVVEPTSIDAEGKLSARAALDRLTTGVGTNLSGGWREAAEAISRLFVAESARRVMLLTDGLPSQGECDPNALKAMVAEGRSHGLETSVIGIGDGIDERLCSRLARAGDGRFHYLRNEGLLGDVIANEIEGARRLAAIDVSVVLALSTRVNRAEVLHRFPCRPDGRTLEIQVGAVTFDAPRSLLVQIEVTEPDTDAVLGAVMAHGRSVMPRKQAVTQAGFALGARGLDAPSGNASNNDNDASTDRISISLPAGQSTEEARRRIAHEVVLLRTLAEIRSAWEGFDRKDNDAVVRRLRRAKDLRRALADAGLLRDDFLATIPNVDAVKNAMLGPSGEAGEARRAFTSWAHNTQVSYMMPAVKVPPKTKTE